MNNAGIRALQLLREIDEKTYDDVDGFNCMGTLFCLKQASLHLTDKGRIVNIASSSATYPWPNAAMYSSSKAAVQKLTEIAAVELGARRINVNWRHPGCHGNSDGVVTAKAGDRSGSGSFALEAFGDAGGILRQ